MRRRSRTGLALALASWIVAGAAAENHPPPECKGAYNVGATTFSAAMTGGRVTTVQVFYPTCAPCNPASSYTISLGAGTYQLRSPLGAAVDAPPAAGPFPLVVYDHGGGGAGADFQRFGQLPVQEVMASHGVITAVALHAADPVVRVRDLPLVLDAMLARSAASGDPLCGRIDPARVGISGSSAGGAASLGVVGGWAAHGIARDGRFKAMVVYEPSILSMDDAKTVAVPYLVMGGLQHKNGQALRGCSRRRRPRPRASACRRRTLRTSITSRTCRPSATRPGSRRCWRTG